MIKKFLAALLALQCLVTPVLAQSQNFQPGYIQGNPTGTLRPGISSSFSSMMDRAFGTSAGGIVYRGPSGWSFLPGNTSGTNALFQSPAGVPTWAPVNALIPSINGKINLVKQQVFTANGTYIPTTGTVQALLECVGPGGGGGGAAGTAAQIYAGGGGGSGEYSYHYALAAEIGTSVPVTIPAGGAGGAGATNGADGAGSSTVASLVSASPGRGGKFGSAASATAVAGGLGGTGGTTDSPSPGAPGGSGFLNAANVSIWIPSGAGGSSRFGGGGIGVSPATTSASNGNAGTGFGSGGSGAAAHSTASTGTGGAGSAGKCVITDYAAQNLIPTPAVPTIIQRIDAITFNVRTPIINGAPGEYVEWQFKNIGKGFGVPINMIELWGVSTSENGVVRVQTDGSIAGAVFEYAMNIGRTDNAFGTYQLAGNGHGNITDSSPSITMDGGSNLINMPIGNYAAGTTLTIAQTPGILLPSTATPNGTPGSAFGTINQGHIVDATGITVSWSTNITQTNAGDNNSYCCMLPTTGMDRIQFGANSPLTIGTHPGSPAQSANQGQISIITTWNSARPDLKLTMTLPNGNPGTPDLWTKVLTSDTFVIQNPTFDKAYVNNRSGATGIAATNSAHLSHYAVTK